MGDDPRPPVAVGVPAVPVEPLEALRHCRDFVGAGVPHAAKNFRTAVQPNLVRTCRSLCAGSAATRNFFSAPGTSEPQFFVELFAGVGSRFHRKR